MVDHVYAVTEVVGTSSESTERAIRNAIETAAETLHDLDWFEVTGTHGHIENGKVGHFQVTVKIGFRYQKQIQVPPRTGEIVQ